MTLEALAATLPPYAKDVKLNLAAVVRPGALTETQVWVAALACAMAARNPDLLRAVEASAAEKLDETHRGAARIAGALMAMNNVYYRALHLMDGRGYESLPAQLRMQGLAGHGIAHLDFELAALAVSAIGGCGRCLESHEKVVREKGATAEAVRDALRLAAVLQSAAVVLDAASARGAEAQAA